MPVFFDAINLNSRDLNNSVPSVNEGIITPQCGVFKRLTEDFSEAHLFAFLLAGEVSAENIKRAGYDKTNVRFVFVSYSCVPYHSSYMEISSSATGRYFFFSFF